MLSPIITSFNQSDFFGKIIFLALFACSLVTWSVLLKKFVEQKNIKKKGFLFARPFQKKRINPLTLEIKELSSPFQRIFYSFQQEAFHIFHKNNGFSANDFELVQEQMELSISDEINLLEKNLFLLSTIVSLGPFLGLLGTVWGILLTFFELQKGATLQSSNVMLGGLAMALATTVIGLVVAIPALIGYNYLRSSSNVIAQEMEDFGQTLLFRLKESYS